MNKKPLIKSFAKVEVLSEKATLSLETIRDKWLKIGTDTTPCNRQKAEQAVAEVMIKHNFAVPSEFEWAGSLQQAQEIANNFFLEIDEESIQRISLNAQVRIIRKDNLTQIPFQFASDPVISKVWDQVRTPVHEKVWAGNWFNLHHLKIKWGGLKAKYEDFLTKTSLKEPPFFPNYTALYGLQEAGRLSFCDFFYHNFDLGMKEEMENQIKLASSVGWWFPLGDKVVMVDRDLLV